MAISTFELRAQSDNALRRELYIAASADLDYETAASRVQRGLLVASRALTSSVTAKEITRGFQLDLTQVEEPAFWSRPLPTITLRVPADLSPVFDTIELDFYAQDPEGTAFAIQTGTVPAPLTALFGVDDNDKDLTITYPAQTANPSSNQSFAIPLFIEQPLGTKIAGTDRNLMVRVLRYAPRGIHTSYRTPANPGPLYIDHGGDHFEITLNDYIQNPDGRPLRVGRGSTFQHSWSGALADYTIGETNGVFSFRGDKKDPYPFSDVRTENLPIRVATNDNGDTDTEFINFILHVTP